MTVGGACANGTNVRPPRDIPSHRVIIHAARHYDGVLGGQFPRKGVPK
jgi:hypothetical protein